MGTRWSQTQNRTFDPESRISSITTGTGAESTTQEMVYDGNGQRLVQSVTSGGNTTRTLYIGGLYEETLTAGESPPYTLYYTLGMGGKSVGMRQGNQSDQAKNTQYRMVGDHLGSTTLIVDTAFLPNVVHKQYYKPYGDVAWESGARRTTIGYTGQRLDGDSGLMYYGARFYDPVLSHFVSADLWCPMRGAKGLQLYHTSMHSKIERRASALGLYGSVAHSLLSAEKKVSIMALS